jgi:hypothetical protein
MNKKKIIIGLVVAGAVIGALYLYNKNKKAKATNTDAEDVSNASGQQIGTTSCNTQNNSVCTQACTNLGGTFNSTDRNCYKNGIAISGGVFGGGRESMKVVR